jgi:hypothetical protein
MATLAGIADIAYADCTRKALSAPGCTLAPSGRFTAFEWIGDNFEAIVLIVMEFMQLGAKRIMARAENATLKRILNALGVSDILTPEEEVAKSASQRLINPGIVEMTT